jgi:hypothetical protein
MAAEQREQLVPHGEELSCRAKGCLFGICYTHAL